MRAKPPLRAPTSKAIGKPPIPHPVPDRGVAAEACGRTDAAARLTALMRRIGIYGLTIVLCAFAAEGISRFVHWGARPMIPYEVDRTGAARLAPLIDFAVKMPGYRRIELVTDALGCRVAHAGQVASDHRGGILFIGDSQVLGWGLPFAETMAARTAAKLDIPIENTWILAAAMQDPAAIRPWVEDYTRAHPQRHRLVVIGLNLGNDLEELAFGSTSLQRGAEIANWLATHSTLYLDWALQKQRFAAGTANRGMIGVNVAMVTPALDRSLLARRIVEAVDRLIQDLPAADQVAVALIPQDSQVALREFEKYRYSYVDDAEFARYRDLQRIAVERLDETTRLIVEGLTARGVIAVELAPALRAHPDMELFDRISHHLLPQGQELAADRIVSVLRQTR